MEIVDLVPSFGGFLGTALAFVVALSIIVAVHELGHYLAGRWSGIQAEVFSIGFGPRLLSWVDRRGTRWQLAALPLGGYVKFLGDADAASSPDHAVVARFDPAQRRATMVGAPLWARTVTVAAGPMANFLFSIAVFAGVVMVSGVPAEAPVVGGLRPLPAAMVQELRPGDRILGIEDAPTPDMAAFAAAAAAVPPKAEVGYRVLREGRELALRGPHPLPALVDAVQPTSAAQTVDIRPGDVVLAVDGVPITTFRELRELVGASDGRAVLLTIWRQGETFEAAVVPRRMDVPLPGGGFETRWLIGVTGGLFFDPEMRRPGPFEALAIGVGQTGAIIGTSLSGLWHMVIGAISTCNLQGPLGIAEASGATASQGLGSFIWFLAVLSAAVGLLNLFPVPVLDGGHLVFYAYEAIAGRPPSERVVQGLMTAGLALLLALMAFALTNDLLC